MLCQKSSYPERLGIDVLLVISVMATFFFFPLIQPQQNTRYLKEAIWAKIRPVSMSDSYVHLEHKSLPAELCQIPEPKNSQIS